ncbi:MAG: A/G-specific adenine glycosylase [Pseudomonadota bacterium]
MGPYDRPNRPHATGAAELSARLLDWYDRHRRVLPWRAGPSERPDTYRVWLSEVMLQQTRAAAVGPYFRAFVARWPDVHALAAASLDEVLAAWVGLGYYARARNLHECARRIAGAPGGRFPDTEAAWRQLPGIGPYTAAAVAAIAFDHPAVVVDGNVERVIARLYAVKAAMPAAKPALRELARALTPRCRAGDYAQGLMDLGATVCTPKRPRCASCPWEDACAARRLGYPERFPKRRAKRDKPARRGVAFVLTRPDGAIWLRRRPQVGLLGGMLEVPSTPWRAAAWTAAAARRQAPLRRPWRPLAGVVRHGFTHFDLELAVWLGLTAGRSPIEGMWCKIEAIDKLALPTLMRKVVAHAISLSTAGRRTT